ncbi:MAG: RusA family crossover junction endodeoxyribonuclease [Cyanobacteria bacterium J06627_32]
MIIPFEVIVFGKPISQQTKDKSRLQSWQATVRKAVKASWSAPLVAEPLLVTLTHFYEADPTNESGVPDSDNIVRPVREVLAGLVYPADLAAIDFISRRRNLNGTFRIRGMSPVLAEGFSKGSEFLHVKMQSLPDPAALN